MSVRRGLISTAMAAVLLIGASNPAEAITIRWTPQFIPIPLPPFPIPPALLALKLDVELNPLQLFPACLPPCLLFGVNLIVNAGVPTVPGQTFFDIGSGDQFAIADTDNTTFLELAAVNPIPLDAGTELVLIESFSTRTINPFLSNQVQFEATGSFGSDRGSVASIPEPGVLLMLSTGLAGLVSFRFLKGT
jgi:hypothetical protein